MKLLSLPVRIGRAIGQTFRSVKALSSVDSGGGGWFSIVREAWGGAWQSGVIVDAPKNLLAFSAVYACVTGIASDVSKLGIDLVAEDADGIYTEVESSPYLAIFTKPNPYQTRLQFIEQWIVQKLLKGNAYILKGRDMRRMVRELYVLDSYRVKPLVAENGDVYYQIARDDLNGVREPITVPASEMIHDRMVCLWHPLVGVSPIYACGTSATLGNKIQNSSAQAFENMSRPSGQLTSPNPINDETAARLKREFEENFRGKNIGRILVSGGGLKYEGMPGIPAADMQLIETLKWTVEDVARAFHYPLYKLGGEIPTRATVEMLNQNYYSDCLQSLIESLESCLDDGLELPTGYCTQVDLDGLLRMDTTARYTAKGEAVKGMWMSPNEARKGENLKPVKGGDSPLAQQQNYSLEALGKRDAGPDPFASKTPTRDGTAPADPGTAVGALVHELVTMLREMKTIPAPQEDEDDVDLREFMKQVIKNLGEADIATIGAS